MTSWGKAAKVLKSRAAYGASGPLSLTPVVGTARDDRGVVVAGCGCLALCCVESALSRECRSAATSRDQPGMPRMSDFGGLSRERRLRGAVAVGKPCP